MEGLLPEGERGVEAVLGRVLPGRRQALDQPVQAPGCVPLVGQFALDEPGHGAGVGEPGLRGLLGAGPVGLDGVDLLREAGGLGPTFGALGREGPLGLAAQPVEALPGLFLDAARRLVQLLVEAFGLFAEAAAGLGLDVPGPVAELPDGFVLAALPGVDAGERPVDVGPGLRPYVVEQPGDVPLESLELARPALDAPPLCLVDLNGLPAAHDRPSCSGTPRRCGGAPQCAGRAPRRPPA